MTVTKNQIDQMGYYKSLGWTNKKIAKAIGITAITVGKYFPRPKESGEAPLCINCNKNKVNIKKAKLCGNCYNNIRITRRNNKKKEKYDNMTNKQKQEALYNYAKEYLKINKDTQKLRNKRKRDAEKVKKGLF